MGLGWFDAIGSTIAPMATGFQQGRLQRQMMEREMQERQQEMAMKLSLNQAQVDYYNRGRNEPAEWHPATMEEARDYELATHPERTERPEPSANQSEWVKAGFPDTEEGRADYLTFVGQKAKTEYPERFRAPAPKASDRVAENTEATGDGFLAHYVGRGVDPKDPQAVAQSGAFSAAYQAIRQSHPDWEPGRVASTAVASMKASQPEMFRAPPKDDLVGDLINRSSSGEWQEEEPPVSQPTTTAPELSPPAPKAPPAPPAPSANKRVITQDQADYLQSIGRWDPGLYEVR